MQITPKMVQVKQSEVSPDGTLILCNYSVLPLRKWTAVILRASDGKLMRAFPDIPGEAPLHWSADGKSILYVATNEGVSNVWTQPVNGGPPRQLTHFMEETIFAMAPSPDGKYLGCIRGKTSSNLVLARAAK